MNLPPVLIKRRLRLFLLLVAIGFGQAVSTVAILLLVRFAFDKLVLPNSAALSGAIGWTGLGLVGAAVCHAWLGKHEQVTAEHLGQDYSHRIRLILFRRLNRLAPRSVQRRSSGALMLRFVGDLTALRNWVSRGLSRIVVAGLTTLIALLVLWSLNWRLGLAVGLSLALGLLSNLRLGSSMRQAVLEARTRRSSLAANIGEKVNYPAVVQAFGQGEREQRRVARQSRRLKQAMVFRAKTIGRMRAMTDGTMGMATAAVFLLGATEVSAGRTSPGTVVAALTVLGLLKPAVQKLGRIHEYYQSAQVSRHKLEEFLLSPGVLTEKKAAPDLQPGPGRLEFRRVRYGQTLKRISAVAEPGSRIALTGANGSGKSTLLDLAARLLDPDGGRILLDGQVLSRHSLSSVRQMIGIVSADLPLLRGTVEKNLRYRWPDAPREEVKKVLAWCGLDAMLDELPKREQTRLLEGGSNLSQGQRQRLAMARALLGTPQLLLLDEADTNLDAESKLVFDRILAEYPGTILTVTHDPRRIAAADNVWQLQAGRLKVIRPAQSPAGGKRDCRKHPHQEAEIATAPFPLIKQASAL